jgi:enoyl-[acyl-carrier protein] reductase I
MLQGKVAAVFGFASVKSIAWGCCQSFQKNGCHVIIGIQNARFRPALERVTADWPVPPTVVECDVTNDADVERTFGSIAAVHNKLHVLVHSIAYASPTAMRGALLDCPRVDFITAHDVSAYSLIALSRASAPLLRASGSGSVIAMSYLGAERLVPQYKVMGAAKASLESVARQLAFEMVCIY